MAADPWISADEFAAREVLAGRRQWAVVTGDAAHVLTLPAGCATAVLTDPPYNLRPYSTGNIKAKWRRTLNNDLAEWDGYFDPKTTLPLVRHLLRPDGNLAAFTAYNLLGKWHDVFDSEYATFQFAVVEKTNPAPKLRRQGFLNACELIVFAWDAKHVWNFTKQAEMRNIVRTPVCGGRERLRWVDSGEAVSPTQKPVKVCRWVLEKTTNPGDLVVDFYAGTASTGVAAVELGRRFIGVERDPVTAEVARRRLLGELKSGKVPASLRLSKV